MQPGNLGGMRLVKRSLAAVGTPKGDIAILGGRLENLGQMQICPRYLFNRGQ
jgi:hypothetical protein